ncbi:MAG TPA: hypothetical protein VH186_04595 [Chloroflexia bacterium]|nr:hypothetical protein [Chloroflexia bacterium]
MEEEPFQRAPVSRYVFPLNPDEIFTEARQLREESKKLRSKFSEVFEELSTFLEKITFLQLPREK